MNEEYCCDVMESMVKKGWVQLDVFPCIDKLIMRFFVVHTDVPHENGGNVGLILSHCFICGKKIYPKSEKEWKGGALNRIEGKRPKPEGKPPEPTPPLPRAS